MKRITIAIAALLLLLAGCSTGESTDEGGASAEATGDAAGVPAVVQPLEVRDIVFEKMAGKKVAFVPISASGFELTAQWGIELQRTLEMVGAEYTIHDPNFDVDKMVQIIDGLINEGVDALVLHNPDVGVLTEQIKTAQSKGIYVVVLNMISNQSADVFIGADVPTAAADIAKRAVSDCEATGGNKVAIIDGFGPDGFSIGANAGWEPVLEEAGFEIVSHQQGKYDPAEANAIATAVLQQHEDLCGFLVNWDIMALGAAEAVDAAGAKGEVGIYSIDGSSTWCAALAEGKVTASSVYHVPGMGVAAAVAVQHLIEIGAPPGSSRTVDYVPHVVVDKTNVDSISSACYSGQ